MTVPSIDHLLPALSSLPPPGPLTPNEIVPIISGVATFGATLALSTLVQKVSGVSTATKVIPSINGFITVCIASLATERAVILTHEYRHNPTKFHRNLSSSSLKRLPATASSSSIPNLRNFSRDDVFSVGPYVKVPMHELRVCLLGLLAFKALGGRFWAIAPSSYTHIGSFARWSIPCTERYATKSQREMIEQMGRRWGCHTCGSRMLFNKGSAARFVGDHMPPKSVAEQMNMAWYRRLKILPKVQFRFYPQCVNCSNTQGSLLSKATNEMKSQSNAGGLGFLPSFVSSSGHLWSKSRQRASFLKDAGGGSTISHFHGGRFRMNHLTGAVLAGTIVVGASADDIVRGNSHRLKSYQHILQSKAKRCINVMRGAIKRESR